MANILAILVREWAFGTLGGMTMFQKREAECVISATDAKNNFGSLIARVAESGEPVVVERQGKGRAAIISMDAYRRFRAFEEAERRREAVETIRRIQKEVSEQNKDMTPEEIEEFAQQFRDEVMEAVVERIAAERGGSIYS
jgi:prevent-host-death family protein